MKTFFHPPTYTVSVSCSVVFAALFFVCIELAYNFAKLIKFHQVNKLTLTGGQGDCGGRQAHVSSRDWLRNFDTQFIVSWEVLLSLSQFMIPKHEYKNIASNNDNGVQYTQQMKKEPHTEWTRYVRLNLFHTNFVLSILVYATNHWKWDRWRWK